MRILVCFACHQQRQLSKPLIARQSQKSARDDEKYTLSVRILQKRKIFREIRPALLLSHSCFCVFGAIPANFSEFSFVLVSFIEFGGITANFIMYKPKQAEIHLITPCIAEIVPF